MTAEPSHSHWDTSQWDASDFAAVPCRTRGRYHVAHVRAVGAPPASILGAHVTAPTSIEPHNADFLQARHFMDLLEDELADLQPQLARSSRRVRAARQGAERHQETVQLRIDEVTALLDALAVRFPTA